MEQIRRPIHRTTLLSWLFISLIIGLAISRTGLAVGEAWWSLPILIVTVGGLVRPSRVAVVIVAVSGLLLGVIQGSAYLESVASYRSMVNQKVIVEGLIKEDPTYGKTGNRQFVLESVRLNQRQLPGELFVSTPTSPDISRHDRVRVSGKLEDGFGPFQASISFAQVSLVAREQHPLDILRRQFASSVTAVLPEPHASLGLGFVIGMKTALPADMTVALQQLSLTHVVVASGYNLTVLVRAAKRLCERQSRLQTLLLSMSLVGLFLLITGNSPSMVRAGLITSLSLLAWYYGRQMQPLVALTLVMAVTAYVYPPFLWGDIGWWLSFAAFAGILLVVPLVTTTFWRERAPPMLAQIAIEALVSQLMTLPISLLFFGNLSVLGLLANVVVVPMIPLAMLLVAIAGFTDMLLPVVAPLVAVPAHAILAVLVWLIYLMSSLPWAAIEVSVGIEALVIWYSCIGCTIGLAWLRVSAEQRREALNRPIV